MKILRRTLTVIAVLFVGAALVKSMLIDKGSGKIPTGEIWRIDGEWEENTDREDFREFSYRLPRNMNGEKLICMENSWVEVRLLLDGEEIYAYEDRYNEFGEQRAWVEIPAGSGGGILTLQITGEHILAEHVIGNAMYLGEKNAVFMQSLMDSLYGLEFFVCMMILFVILLTIRLKIRRKLSLKYNRQIITLGLLILDMAVWILAESDILQLFIRRTAVINLLSFVSFCMLSGFFAFFMKESMVTPGRTFDIIFDISAITATLVAAVYLFRFLPVYELLVFHHVLMIIFIPVILRKGFQEVRKYKNKEQRRIMMGYACFGVCAMVSFALYYTGLDDHYTYFYMAGFLMFLVFIGLAVYEEIYLHLEQSVESDFYQKMAVVDRMTGMGNRAAFDLLMENEKPSEGIAFIMIDNNNLKTVNDEYGHQEGDELLKETAGCIMETLGRMGRCFRIGGDEFLVVLNNMTEEDVKNSLDFMTARIREANDNRRIPVEVAYGYYISTDSDMNMREIFKNADWYMYRNKKRMKELK